MNFLNCFFAIISTIMVLAAPLIPWANDYLKSHVRKIVEEILLEILTVQPTVPAPSMSAEADPVSPMDTLGDPHRSYYHHFDRSSVDYNGLSTLADLMQGKPQSPEVRLVAVETAYRVEGTNLYDEMVGQIDGARDRVAAAFDELSVKFNY